ncbi:MAG: cytochrome b5-like heme/steroid binding domain-containing protein [Patescibacteria group bacterium]|jgi:cytochrome b involved in lipid metabolism
MNKIVIIFVFIFWTALCFFYANSLFKDDDAITKNLNNTNQLENTNDSGTITKSTLALELSNHNNQNDCWLLISNKIYNVTEYIYSHPGGANEITKYCGQDATRAFATMDKTRPKDHSNTAYSLLEKYYIGEATSISASVNTNSNNPTNSNKNSVNNNQNTTSPEPTTPIPVTYTLTTALVAQHNSSADCWATVGSNVYNVTSYISSHPGGSSNITKYCGADIAAAFTAQGHSANASNILASYKIGTIGSTVSPDTLNSTPPPSTNNNIGRGDDDEEEDDD